MRLLNGRPVRNRPMIVSTLNWLHVTALAVRRVAAAWLRNPSVKARIVSRSNRRAMKSSKTVLPKTLYGNRVVKQFVKFTVLTAGLASAGPGLLVVVKVIVLKFLAELLLNRRRS